jgi:CHASE domain
MANRNAVSVFISFSTMASMYPSNAEKSHETLPYVTIKGFDEIAQGFRNVSKATYIHYKPLLHTRADLQKWQNYTASNFDWLATGRKRVNYGAEPVSDQFVPFVYQVVNGTVPIPVQGDGPYTPAWQISPVPNKLNIINFDAQSLENSKTSMDYVMKTGKPSLTEPLPGIRAYFTFPVEGPISPLYQPVFDKSDDEEDRTVVGFLSGYLPWKYFFDNVLPEGQRDTLVVVQSCATSSTFLVNGPEATFVGDGDLHDAKYGQMRQTRSFIAGDNELSNSTVKVQCNHLVHVYPTAALEASFKTKTPMHNAVIIVSIFVFAALVFLMYDYFVTSRQNRTEKVADKSNAIVQELFPGDMAARVFENKEIVVSGGRNSKNKSGVGKVDRNTIAELHPEATVLCKSVHTRPFSVGTICALL